MNFLDLEISEDILKAIGEMGYEKPSPIQVEAIPIVKLGRDLLAQAKTGTGKTAAFGIPAIEKVDPTSDKLQCVILCPTRELAIQVSNEVIKFAKYTEGLIVDVVYGGQPIDRQIRSLKRKPQIVVGTPGRMIDHLNRRTLRFDNVNTVILDEADEMLAIGFQEELETILSAMPKERQTLLFSATVPPRVEKIAKKFLNDPLVIERKDNVMTVSSITQYYLVMKESDKLEVLSRLLDVYNPKLSVVFCNTKKRVDEVVGQLQDRGYFAEALHGDLSQEMRDNVMKKFRRGTIDILVATDVAARGIDVDDVQCVFNYDRPQEHEYYVHRIGRTGRAGKEGISFTLTSSRDLRFIKMIAKETGSNIERLEIPSLEDVKSKKIMTYLNKVETEIEKKEYHSFHPYAFELLSKGYDYEQIALALIKMAVNIETSQKIDESLGKKADGDLVRCFINVGKKDDVRPRHIVGAIANECKVASEDINDVTIMSTYSFVSLPASVIPNVLEIMNQTTINKRKVQMEVSDEKSPRQRASRRKPGEGSHNSRGYSDRKSGGDRGNDRNRGGRSGGGRSSERSSSRSNSSKPRTRTENK